MDDNNHPHTPQHKQLAARRFAPLLLWIIILEAIGAGISILTAAPVDDWYAQLKRAPLTPPDMTFGIVWPALYALIAVAGWRLWQRRHQPHIKPLLALFAGQMLMNWAWSLLFFTAHLLWPSCLWIGLLVAIVTALIIRAWKYERPTEYLLLPYLAWISFATYLSAYIALYNP